MKRATVVRTQIAAALFSLASLVVFAASSPADPAQEVQSFIGTTPNASVVAEQPATF
jgi:hypothetical protein